jgi:hypothetical protein
MIRAIELYRAHFGWACDVFLMVGAAREEVLVHPEAGGF